MNATDPPLFYFLHLGSYHRWVELLDLICHRFNGTVLAICYVPYIGLAKKDYRTSRVIGHVSRYPPE